MSAPPVRGARTPRPLRFGTLRPRSVDRWLGAGLLGVGAIALGAFDWYVSGGPAAAMHWPLAIPLVLGGAALTSGLAVAWRLRVRAALTARDQALGERIDAVLAIADRLARAVDREEIFRTIVTDMNRVLRADATTIRLLRDDRLEPVAWARIADDAAARLPVLGRDEGWFGEMLRTGRPWVCDDTRAPDRAWVYERYAAPSSSARTSPSRSSTTTG